MAKRIDLTDKTFGEWKVIKYAGNRRWLCRCSCGTEREVEGNRLRNGTSKSCGHDTTLFKDMTGMQFGDWKVLSQDKNKNGYWICRCSCGTVRSVSGFHLRAGRTNSCGHGGSGFIGNEYISKNEKAPDSEKLYSINAGDIIHEWEVLERTEDSYWLCRCSCGKEELVHDWALKTGKSKSCGHSQLEDLTDRHFGEWTVLRYVGSSYWECRCSCGEIRNIRKTDLVLGKSLSCGHSIREPKINLAGNRYGMLKVQEYIGESKYRCICDCGNTTEVLSCNLVSGGTISCGCQKISKYTKDYLEDIINEYAELKGEFPYICDLAGLLEIDEGYACRLVKRFDLEHMINRSFRSRYEREICDYIKSLDENIDIITGDKSVLNNYELDILIKSRKLAIEFNGNYWHSENKKDMCYHQRKTLECAKQGIQLIHIFEYEWKNEDTKEKLKSIIKSKIINKNRNRIYARNCSIKNISKEEEANFLNKYHLQGATYSSKAYGLFSENCLVSIMTFGKPRFNQECDLELIRYCTDNENIVIGGAEKLFKHSMNDLKPKSVVTYCDISKFTGNVYTRLGFQTSQSCITKPNYKWVDTYEKGSNDVLSRYQTQKQYLINEGFGVYGNTEDEIMINRGYTKIYDSGNLRLQWTNNELYE